MNRSRRKRAAVLMVATAMLAACSDDDEASDNTDAVTSRTPAAELPETTMSTFVIDFDVPTTTPAPTTTVDVVAITKQAVADAAVASREAYLYAVYNLDAPDAMERLEATTAAGSDSLALALDNVETLRTNGCRARPHPEIPDSLTVESEVELLDGPPASTAEVTVCVIGAGIVYEPAAAPDGSDTIVNDEITARRSRITLVLENGSWKLSSGVGLGEWSATSCPAA